MVGKAIHVLLERLCLVAFVACFVLSVLLLLARLKTQPIGFKVALFVIIMVIFGFLVFLVLAAHN